MTGGRQFLLPPNEIDKRQAQRPRPSKEFALHVIRIASFPNHAGALRVLAKRQIFGVNGCRGVANCRAGGVTHRVGDSGLDGARASRFSVAVRWFETESHFQFVENISDLFGRSTGKGRALDLTRTSPPPLLAVTGHAATPACSAPLSSTQQERHGARCL